MFNHSRWLGLDVARNRWVFPVAGAVSTTLIGAAYAFSIFVKPLESEFGWLRAQTTSAFSIAMLMFGFFGFVAGAMADRWGPRRPFVIGAILMAVSQVLASQVQSIGGLVLSYGVLLGSGLGLIYGSATVPLMARWYPDAQSRGVAIGVSMMGMGIGSLIAAPVWTWSIAQFGWRATYLGTGVVYLVVLAVVATLVRYPHASLTYRPGRGWAVDSPDDEAAIPASRAERDFSFGEALARPHLYLMALLFFLTVFGGTMILSQLAAYVVDPAPVGAGLSAASAAKLVMVLAFFNGLGRPAWGWISGRIGIRRSLAICPLLMTGAMALFSMESGFVTVALAAMLCGFSFGGMLALVPIMTNALFGSTFVGRIYGCIYFLGFGIGGFCGPLAGGFMVDRHGSYLLAFALSGVMALASASLAGALLPGRGREHLRGEELHPGAVGTRSARA